MNTDLEHREACTGIVVVTWHGIPSSSRYRLTRCTDCGAQSIESANRHEPAVVSEGGCDR